MQWCGPLFASRLEDVCVKGLTSLQCGGPSFLTETGLLLPRQRVMCVCTHLHVCVAFVNIPEIAGNQGLPGRSLLADNRGQAR